MLWSLGKEIFEHGKKNKQIKKKKQSSQKLEQLCMNHQLTPANAM
jgi:hypothetical protein